MIRARQENVQNTLAKPAGSCLLAFNRAIPITPFAFFREMTMNKAHLSDPALVPAKTVTRRRFLEQTAIGTAGLLTARRLRGAGATPDIEVLLDEPIGTISPDIYGHFTEHIGGVIYDGIWVGPGSKIPNQGGIRTALVDHM